MHFKLPEKINPGEELEVQLAPLGDWPNVDAKGKKVVQRVTAEAVSRLVANFDGEVLVDVDHDSIGGSTEAAAWVTGLRADPEKGLVGTFKFTDTGAEAVSNRRYRFVSVAWVLDENGEPCRLDSVALTNRPNLPVHPILNSTAGGGTAEPTKEPAMDKLKEMLGLGPDADDAAIEAAVQALIDADAEAEKFAEENEGKCDKEALKTDPVWTRISRFGTPYPPFDFNSGMGIEDVDRADALNLGIVKKDDPPQHVERTGFNDGLATTVTGMRSDSDEAKKLKELFGDQISILNSQVRWEGGLIQDVIDGKAKKCSFGKATQDFLAKCPEEARKYLEGTSISLSRQFFVEHGAKHADGNETRKDMIPLRKSDYELLPCLWRNPDKVTSARNGRIEISKMRGC